MATLAPCTTLAVILKEQSNSISKYLFVARQFGDDVSEGSVYCSLVSENEASSLRERRMESQLSESM